MGDLYASAIGTTVLQLKEIPQRPEDFDGKVVLFGVRGGASDIEAALCEFGEIVRDSCEVGDVTIVRFATHAAAVEASQASASELGLGKYFTMHYNEREYDGRGW